MTSRTRRLFVGSVSSIVWPALVVVIPAGITFAAARVYAESGVIADCDAGGVIACADAASTNRTCTGCGNATCACQPNVTCLNGSAVMTASFCTPLVSCDAPGAQGTCAGKDAGDTCSLADANASCVAGSEACLPSDGGVVTTRSTLTCTANGANPNSSSSSSGAADVPFNPGPDKVPGSSSSSGGTKDDSGCSTSSTSTSLPLLAGPLALGLLFALRRRQPKKAPSARKRS